MMSTTTALIALTSLALSPGPNVENDLIIDYYPIIESFESVNYEKVQDIPKRSCSDRDDEIIDIATHALNAGFVEENLLTAVAVAFAESNGNPKATNTNNNGSIDRGTWQINSVHKWVDLDRIFDPGYNAEVAFRIWESGGWTQWYAHTPKGSAYGSGRRFQEWLETVDCLIGDDDAYRTDALPSLREGPRPE